MIRYILPLGCDFILFGHRIMILKRLIAERNVIFIKPVMDYWLLDMVGIDPRPTEHQGGVNHWATLCFENHGKTFRMCYKKEGDI